MGLPREEEEDVGGSGVCTFTKAVVEVYTQLTLKKNPEAIFHLKDNETASAFAQRTQTLRRPIFDFTKVALTVMRVVSSLGIGAIFALCRGVFPTTVCALSKADKEGFVQWCHDNTRHTHQTNQVFWDHAMKLAGGLGYRQINNKEKIIFFDEELQALSGVHVSYELKIAFLVPLAIKGASIGSEAPGSKPSSGDESSGDESSGGNSPHEGASGSKRKRGGKSHPSKGVKRPDDFSFSSVR